MPAKTSFPSSGKAMLELEVLSETPRIYVLHFLGAQTPDNRLTRGFLTALNEALAYVWKEWEGIAGEQAGAQGAALITTGVVDESNKSNKFYSNGLDFEAAIADATFFDECLFPAYERLLSFPIPTIASINGHAFAAGFGLIAAHDYRVMSANKGFAAMNEIDFGAQVPPGLHAALLAKITSPALMRKIILEGHRFTGPDLHAHQIVDVLSPAKGEQGGGAKTLETAIELAKKVAPKAAKDCYGSNKLVLYEPQLAILRKANSDALDVLTAGSKL